MATEREAEREREEMETRKRDHMAIARRGTTSIGT